MTKNIAVLMGGYSSEFAISLQSGATVLDHLDSDLYSGYAVHILKDKWVCLYRDQEYPINKRDFSCDLPEGTLHFDACYNTIHGSPGEDGMMQAYLALLNIPQTSSDFYQSALTFNKKDTLSVLRAYGIPMAQSIYVDKANENVYAFAKAQLEQSQISYPVFVKPNRAGSSYGVSKVYTEADLDNALDKAFTEDHEVLIESYLKGTEVSVGVYQDRGKTTVLPVCEIVPDGDFFDLEAKYSGKSQEIVPARISEAQTQQVQALTLKIYELLKLKGICRIDFIFDQGRAHFVEVNTNPGLSSQSIVPREFAAAGITLKEAFGQAIAAVL